MKTNFEMVKEFHEAFGQPVRTTPVLIDAAETALRIRLISEEFDETLEAMTNAKNFVDSGEDHDSASAERKKLLMEVGKELADLIYVVAGTALHYGLDIDKVFAEVHRSNMSKLGEDGKPVYRSDGKVLKGKSFTKADLSFLF